MISTARRQLEDRLRPIQKMEESATWRRDGSTTFNNILAGIMLSLELAQMHNMDGEARDLLQGSSPAAAGG